MRIARLFDTVDPITGPAMDPNHPRLDPAEAHQVLGYLRGGAVVLHTTARVDDVVDPLRRNAVGLTLRTDGQWIWSEATAYYLEEHRLAPDAQLLAAIRAHDFVMSFVDDESVGRAVAALQEPDPGDPVVWTTA